MKYLRIDVHSRASVWCMLDGQGEVVRRGETETSAPALESLAREWMAGGRLVVGQEVGAMAYLVHGAITGAGAEVLSFKAQQLRMIACWRKKSDRRDGYWIARAAQDRRSFLKANVKKLSGPGIRIVRSSSSGSRRWRGASAARGCLSSAWTPRRRK